MELTPKLLETQHFPERFRGYDPDAVDDFLERVAVGLGEMQARLDDVADRIIDAETRASSNGENGEVQVHDGRPGPVESIKEALETAPRLESGLASSVAGANNQGAVAIGATKIEIDRIAQLISLAQQTADDVVEDAIVAAREQIADLLADVLVASSSELAATGAIARKAELESELLELDARISARRNDADQLAELIETRRRALGEIARDLSGRPDGPPDQHPATSTIEGVAVIDESTTAAPDQGATQRPAREIRSGDDIEDPFFSALQRREPLEGE
ncbi:MAG: DivIVA domain-containing protein [Acidimicrobiales bacterium]|jgi:DivIVA domain-containing protein|nr:DivIVA domain-containing protein [Acidimicrobiales bacterium]